MKMMKKLAALGLAIALTLGMATTAMAADITVEGAVKGQTYKAYKIFEVTKGDNGNAVSYWMTAGQYNIWGAKLVENGITPVIRSDGNYNIPVNAFGTDEETAKAKAATLAAALNTVANKGTPMKKATGTESGNKIVATFSGLESGYYFIDSSLGAVCALWDTDDSSKVIEKNEKPDVTKKVGEDLQAAISAYVGQEIPFTVTVKAGGAADTSYVLHDKMSNGLDLVANSFAIKVNNVDVPSQNYTITTTGLEDDCDFEIEFLQSYTKDLAKDTEIVVTYTAKVNANAVTANTATTDDTNDVILQYGNSSTTEGTETKVHVFTGSVTVTKYDGNNNDAATNKLSDAQFKIIDTSTVTNATKYLTYSASTGYGWTTDKNAENIVIMTTDSEGKASVKGLAAGTYYLLETVAPEGYNLMANPEAFTISMNEGNTVITSATPNVANYAGSTLPSTGGIGTTIFYVTGGLLVIVAVVLLVTKKRMSNRA